MISTKKGKKHQKSSFKNARKMGAKRPEFLVILYYLCLFFYGKLHYSLNFYGHKFGHKM